MATQSLSSISLPLSVLVLSICQTAVCQSAYVLKNSITPQTFLDSFEFWTASDPSEGFVQYVNQSYAQQQGLVSVTPEGVRLGVDSSNFYDAQGGGRASVRLEGKDQFTRGLFILDATHMPEGCGTWPAFWAYGPNWPSSGEIDIIEGANRATNNLMSLHTSSGCSIAGSDQSGTLVTNDCDAEQNYNSGCGVQSTTSQSYGAGFNSIGGGVFAMEWTSAAIKIWFFPRNAIPDSITSGSPDPLSFGTPSANFQGSCDIDSHFANNHLVFDTTFCGDYAGRTYEASGCPLYAGLNGYDSCKKYVAENPSAFTNAYWEVKSLRVFQLAGNASTVTDRLDTASLSSVLPVVSTRPLSSINPAQGENTERSSISSSTFSPPVPALSTGNANQTSRTAETAKPQFQSPTALPFATINPTRFRNTTSNAALPTFSSIQPSPSTRALEPSVQGTGLPNALPDTGLNGSTALLDFASISTAMVYVTETVIACPSVSQTCRIPQMQRRDL